MRLSSLTKKLSLAALLAVPLSAQSATELKLDRNGKPLYTQEHSIKDEGVIHNRSLEPGQALRIVAPSGYAIDGLVNPMPTQDASRDGVITFDELYHLGRKAVVNFAVRGEKGYLLKFNLTTRNDAGYVSPTQTVITSQAGPLVPSAPVAVTPAAPVTVSPPAVQTAPLPSVVQPSSQTYVVPAPIAANPSSPILSNEPVSLPPAPLPGTIASPQTPGAAPAPIITQPQGQTRAPSSSVDRYSIRPAPNPIPGGELEQLFRIAKEKIDGYIVEVHRADGNVEYTPLQVPKNPKVIEMYSVQKDGKVGVFDLCPGDYAKVIPPSGRDVHHFMPTNRNSRQVRAMFGDNWTVTYDELTTELNRTGKGYSVGVVNAELRRGRHRLASSRADLVFTRGNACTQPQTLESHVQTPVQINGDVNIVVTAPQPASSPEPRQTVPAGNAGSQGADENNAKGTTGAGGNASTTPYGDSYTQLTILGGRGQENNGGKNPDGTTIPAYSAKLQQFALQLAHFRANAKFTVNYAHTRATDGGLTGMANYFPGSIYANNLRANSINASADVLPLKVGPVRFGGHGSVGYAGITTDVGRVNETSRQSNLFYTAGAAVAFGSLNKSYALMSLRVTAQPINAKYQSTAYPGYTAESSLEMTPHVAFDSRAFLTSKLFVDFAGKYGFAKTNYTTASERLRSDSRFWNASIGLNYDVLQSKDGSKALGAYLQFNTSHNNENFGTLTTFKDMNTVRGGINFTFGKR